MTQNVSGPNTKTILFETDFHPEMSLKNAQGHLLCDGSNEDCHAEVKPTPTPPHPCSTPPSPPKCSDNILTQAKTKVTHLYFTL